jgi:hypothetical protein
MELKAGSFLYHLLGVTLREFYMTKIKDVVQPENIAEVKKHETGDEVLFF